MAADATVVDESFTGIISSFFDNMDSVFIVNPAPDVFQTVMLTVSTFDNDLPDIQVLATPDVLKTSMDDFILASQTADLIDQGKLELHTTTDITQGSLLVSDDEIVTVVTFLDEMTGLRAMDDELVENLRSTFIDFWDDADAFTLRTPPLSHVQETLAEEFGEEVKDDFMSMVESMDMVPGEDDNLDEVAIALLVAANNGVLLYDIGKWGEDTGVASKATFSRTKTQLENRGLIETEKVPIDVGRPRQRLVLVPDDLEDVDSLAEQVTA